MDEAQTIAARITTVKSHVAKTVSFENFADPRLYWA